MKRFKILSAILLTVIACGRSNDKNAPGLLDASPLAGTYQQAPNGSARLQISPENLVTGTTLTIPSQVVGNETRLTPQFQQSLVYNPDTGLYSTIGTFNDADGTFKNVEMRVRLYEQNTLLDVTLITPPDEAITTRAVGTSRVLDGSVAQSESVSQNGGSCDQNPNQNQPGVVCPVCLKIPQAMYTFRFVRI